MIATRRWCMSRSCGMHSSLRRADGQRNAQSSLSALTGQCGVQHSAQVLDFHWKRHLDRHCSLLVLQLIQTVSHHPPGQKWKQFSYQVGSLFDSIVSPWVTFGGLEMQFSGLQTDVGTQIALWPSSQEINLPLWIHFGIQNTSTKVTRTSCKGVQKWFQRKPTFREPNNEILLFIHYT